MKVKELIEALKKLNQETEIGVVDDGSSINIYAIYGDEKTAYAICGSSYADFIDVDFSNVTILEE